MITFRKRTKAEILDYFSSYALQKGDKIIHYVKTIDGKYGKPLKIIVE